MVSMSRIVLIAAVMLSASIALAQPALDPSLGAQNRLATLVEAQRPGKVRSILGEPNEAELTSHRHYKAKDGHEVHSPAKSTHDQVPAGASAKCRDGTYSFSQHRRGTCSHHGGVNSWL